MKNEINSIIRRISEFNNIYRNATANTHTKLAALWEIGDLLVNIGIEKPHKLGWEIQRATDGLIKRPTIFRSYKIRTIWPVKEDLYKDIGGIKRISFLTEMLPLIDPAQNVRSRLEEKELRLIFQLSCSKDAKKFNNSINALKRKYSHGRLGSPLNKARHLSALRDIVNDYSSLFNTLTEIMASDKLIQRNVLRREIEKDEMRAFSNMCLSLTTKENIKLYRKSLIVTSISRNIQFKRLFDFFCFILNQADDAQRARIRRLISSESMARIADLFSSIQSEENVEDYLYRQQIAIKL